MDKFTELNILLTGQNVSGISKSVGRLLLSDGKTPSKPPTKGQVRRLNKRLKKERKLKSQQTTKIRVKKKKYTNHMELMYSNRSKLLTSADLSLLNRVKGVSSNLVLYEPSVASGKNSCYYIVTKSAHIACRNLTIKEIKK